MFRNHQEKCVSHERIQLETVNILPNARVKISFVYDTSTLYVQLTDKQSLDIMEEILQETGSHCQTGVLSNYYPYFNWLKHEKFSNIFCQLFLLYVILKPDKMCNLQAWHCYIFLCLKDMLIFYVYLFNTKIQEEKKCFLYKVKCFNLQNKSSSSTIKNLIVISDIALLASFKLSSVNGISEITS